jgi:hypothetical protein
MEFEVPYARFELPKDGAPVKVEYDHGTSCTARVVGRNGSKPGRYRAGLTVRLALKLEDGEQWRYGTAHITWPGRSEAVDLFVTLEPPL